jgi:uncharacterized protein HemX
MLKRVIVVLVVVLLLGGGIAGWAEMRHPHLRAALDHLQAARSELQLAEPNKGGHREKAIEFVDRAIEQTKRGIEFGEHEYR